MLKDNPFYILNVPMSASRREIASKVEEQSFFFDPDACNEAQACLTNPAKRISAEVNWFPGESEDTIAEIRAAIDSGKDVDTRSLGVAGQLNATLDSFARNKQSKSELIQGINTIDVYFDINDADSLCDEINVERKKAGIAETDISKVIEEQQKLREKIRTIITEKFSEYSDDDYVKMISEIAESCMANSELSHGVIIDDVINQYELRMQPVIEEKTTGLEEMMQGIIDQATDPAVRKMRVSNFVKALKDWDVYVQPLQLRTQAEGYAHSISQRVASQARTLAIILHNEVNAVADATTIMEAMREVFKELPEFAAILDGDLNTLAENKAAANRYYRGGNTYVGANQSGTNSGSSSQSSSVIGDIFKLILTIALRFWWIILILIISLVNCDGSDTGTSSTTNNSNSSTYSEESSDYSDPYEGLVEQEMPENEHKFVNTFGDNRPSQIIVENPTDYAYVMKFEDASGKTVFSFFVRPQSTTPMYMGLGTYYLKWAAGKTWYGEEDLFGPDTVYQKDPETWPFESGKYWTLTMQPVSNGNVHSNSIDADDF